MIEYKRFISYIYSYNNGEKENNCGYAKIEAKNGICKFTINIKDCDNLGEKLDIYIFYRDTTNKYIIAIPACSISLNNNICDCSIKTDKDNLFNSKQKLDNMCGIIAISSNKKIFATEWDDNIFQTSNIIKHEEYYNTGKKVALLRNSKASLQTSKKANSPETVSTSAVLTLDKDNAAIRELKHDISNDNTIDSNDNAILNNKAVNNHIFSDNDVVADNEGLNNDIFSANNTVADNETLNNSIFSGNNTVADNKALNNNLFSGNNTVTNNDIDSVTIGPVKIESNNTRNKSALSNIIHNKKTTYTNQKHNNTTRPAPPQSRYVAPPKLKTTLADRIFDQFPGMYPFEDDEIIDCVKLEPQDIGIFPMDKWILANNSFLLHGYYTYRHLIFARLRYDNDVRFILGVPGVYRDRERFMANMFGFTNFKSIKNSPKSTGDFGYWYMDIRL